MYLEKLEIKNFRSISHLVVHFQKGVNIIIGENNSGKSAIVDVLRITLGYGKQWRDIGVRNDEDFFIDVSEIKDALDPIEFHLTFKVELDEDREVFLGMIVQDPIDVNLQTIQIHFRYYLEENALGNKTLKYKIWAGAQEDTPAKPEEFQQIYFSYLAALRNAELELRPYARDNKVISLFKEMSKYTVVNEAGDAQVKDLNLEAKKELAQKLKNVVEDQDWAGLIKSGENLVNEHLENADISRKHSKIHLRLLEYEYNNIIKGMLLRRPAYDADLLGDDITRQKFFDISQNGLGENNLIYAASVLGDLKNRRSLKKEHFYALLIEEPEAHLHPQKQNTFFNYLNNLQELDVQIFITSHSPTLAAKSNLDNLLVLQRQANKISLFSLKNSGLTKENKEYLRKFLDVTKSQIFFSNGAILVEGISEALLVPVFARMMSPSHNLDKNGVELVNVNGVSFDPFARLFNNELLDKRMPARCAIITDDDKGLISTSHFVSVENAIDKTVARKIFSHLVSVGIINIDNRIENYAEGTDLALIDDLTPFEVFIRNTLAAKFIAISPRAANAQTLPAGNLKAFFGEYTFEFELLTQNDFNYRVMHRVYKWMHPRTEFSSSVNIRERAFHFLETLNRNKDKSQLAENLAFFLERHPASRRKFVIPDYIKRAVKWVVDGE